MTGRSEGFLQVRKFWQVFLVGFLFRTEKNGKNRGEKKCCLTLCLGIRVCNTRAHVVIVILSLLGICKAPKIQHGIFGGFHLLIGSGDFLEFRFKPEVLFCGFRLFPNSHLPVTHVPPSGGGLQSRTRLHPLPVCSFSPFCFVHFFPDQRACLEVTFYCALFPMYATFPSITTI